MKTFLAVPKHRDRAVDACRAATLFALEGLIHLPARLRNRMQITRRQSLALVRFSLGVCGAVWAAGPKASAQTPAQLAVQTYAGLTITGAVGIVYSVECVTDLTLTNTPSAWHCLEFLRLPASPYLWADRSAAATGKRFYRARVFPVPTNMVFIPPGTFRMGSPTNETGHSAFEAPQTDVIISRGFWIGKYEVTQGEYLAVIGNNPSSFTGDTNRPVESVSWYWVTRYCGTLTDRERVAGRIPTNCVYRLPTEAEWEYACRAWTSDRRFSYGEDPAYTNLVNYAWYGDLGGPTTHPAGQKLPNPWGLYDMSGNVWELCQDWWAAKLPGGIVVDPQGPATGSWHVFRGGCYFTEASGCRSACRTFGEPGAASVGFRVVLAPGQP